MSRDGRRGGGGGGVGEPAAPLQARTGGGAWRFSAREKREQGVYRCGALLQVSASPQIGGDPSVQKGSEHICCRSVDPKAARYRRECRFPAHMYIHTYTHLCTNLPSASRSHFAARGRGSKRRAHGGCSTWLSRWGLRRGKDLTEKGGGAPQPPAAGHRGRTGEGRGRWRASGHLPAAREAPGCGHTAAGPRRSPGPAGVCGPAPRRNGSGRNFAADGGAAGNKLENGSALVSKSQRRERLATIMISVTSVKYSIIRDYSSTYCK